MVLAIVAACVAVAVALIDRQHVIAANSRTVCVKIHRLDDAIVSLIAAQASPQALSRESYYRRHPDEIAAAVAAARREIAVLRAADCTQ